MTRPPKRNKKKKKPPPKQNVISAIDLYNHATVIKANGIVVSKMGHNDIGRNNGPVIQASNGQEFFTICENSSAYESSEDTGVGGLSESELIGTSDGNFFYYYLFLETNTGNWCDFIFIK